MEHLQKMLIPSKQQDTQLVDARLLHEKLNVQTRFNDWIKNRIKEYGFEEGQDFATQILVAKNRRGGHNKIEYHISLDMAKELAMLERTEQGRTIRKYFIACEKALRTPKQDLQRYTPPKYTLDGIKKAIQKVQINGKDFYALNQASKALGYKHKSNITYQKAKKPNCFIQVNGKYYVNDEYLDLLVKRANTRYIILEAEKASQQAKSALPEGFRQPLLFAAYSSSSDDLIN